MTAIKSLYDLFCELFNQEDLIIFCMNFSEFHWLKAQLKSDNLAGAVSSFLDAYARNRGFDGELYRQLIVARPHHEGKIRRIMSDNGHHVLFTGPPQQPINDDVSSALMEGLDDEGTSPFELSPLSVVSCFGTTGYRMTGAERMAIAIHHTSGTFKGQTFVIRKGIALSVRKFWFHLEPQLGFPISNEFANKHGMRSNFEGGHVNWYGPEGDSCTGVAPVRFFNKDRLLLLETII